MWAIRMLSGNHAGQIYPLKEGTNLIGRGNHCNIRFDESNISKEHALILFENQNLTLVDNQSRNGTFVNGVMINKTNLKRGDKISFNQTLCDVIQLPVRNQKNLNLVPSPQGANKPLGLHQNSHALGVPQEYLPPAGLGQVSYPFAHSTPTESEANFKSSSHSNFFIRYFEEVLMPGVYHLGQIMEYKIVIGLFMVIYAFLVTSLSTIPMIAITSDSIQLESRRRALTIARNLANLNQQALLKEMETALSTQTADLEEGVSQAYIIRQSDGSVIAPATKAGTIPSLPFIEMARREQKELIKQIDSSHVAVAVPLSAFNPETSTYTIKAFAIVIYDMGALAVDDGRTLSLFFQTLLIALLLGFVLYYLFYRFVEHPIAETNKQLDLLLKKKADSVLNIKIEFPIFQSLISNINTLLTRVTEQDHSPSDFGNNTKEFEISNITKMVGYACLSISSDLLIIAINSAAEELLGINENQLRNQPIALIPDQALQKSLHDLMEHANQNTASPSRNELEFSGSNTEINCQAITERGKVKYYLITIIPLEGSN